MSCLHNEFFRMNLKGIRVAQNFYFTINLILFHFYFSRNQKLEIIGVQKNYGVLTSKIKFGFPGKAQLR